MDHEELLCLNLNTFVHDAAYYAYEMKNARFLPNVPMKLDRIEVDYKLKAVAVGVGNSEDPVPIMRAAYREGLGCMVMGLDQTFADIDKLPKLEMAPLPKNAEMQISAET